MSEQTKAAGLTERQDTEGLAARLEYLGTRKGAPISAFAPELLDAAARLRELEAEAVAMAHGLEVIGGEVCGCITNRGPDDYTCPACIAKAALANVRDPWRPVDELEAAERENARLRHVVEAAEGLRVATRRAIGELQDALPSCQARAEQMLIEGLKVYDAARATSEANDTQENGNA